MTRHAKHPTRAPFVELRRLCRAAALGITVSTLFFCTTGCARQAGETLSVESTQEVMRQIDPAPLRLSQDAQHLYYNLLLADGIADNSPNVIAAALQRLLKLDPSASMYGNAAATMLSRGEYALATQMAGEGLQRHPDDTRLTLILTGIYTETGQLPKATELLEKHVKKNPSSPDITQALVRLYLSTGQDDKAAALMSVLPRTDKSPEADLFRASVLTTVGREAEAKKLLQDLLKKNPKLFEAWLELGYIAEGEKKFSEALKAYGKAADLMPDNDELLMRLAALHIQLKEPDKALAQIEKMQPSAVSYLQAAARFFESGYTSQAERMLDKASATGGSPDEINIVRSMIKQEQSKNPAEALAPLDKVPASSPLYSSALLQKARIHLNARNYDQLAAVSREGQGKFPEISEFIKLEAFALVRLQKKDEAIALMKKNLKRNPGDEDMLYSLGSVYDEAGNKEEALATMERLLVINPKNYQALNYVGYTLAEKNTDLSRALTLVTAALEQYPDADYIVDSLAWVQYRLGRFEDAWKSINRCIELGGDDGAMWDHYGDIAMALGKKSDAVKGYTKAVERQPENVEDIRKKLSGLSGTN